MTPPSCPWRKVPEKLRPRVDSAIAIAIHDDESVIPSYPAGTGSDAIAIMIEQNRSQPDWHGFDPVAVQINYERISPCRPRKLNKETLDIRTLQISNSVQRKYRLSYACTNPYCRVRQERNQPQRGLKHLADSLPYLRPLLLLIYGYGQPNNFVYEGTPVRTKGDYPDPF